MYRLLIINYHEIIDEGRQPSTPYTIQLSVFKRHLQLILASGWRVISLDELCDPFALKGKLLAITFDDGNSSDYKHAWPLLKRSGLSACFFPSIEVIKDNADYVQWLSEMEEGKIFGSHGWHHLPLDKGGTSGVEKELASSRAYLELKTRRPVNHFAPPFGRVDKQLRRLVVKSGYRFSFSTGFAVNTPYSTDVLGRFSVKSSTSQEEFTRILSMRPGTLFLKTVNSQIRHACIRLFGFRRVHQLHLFITKITGA